MFPNSTTIFIDAFIVALNAKNLSQDTLRWYKGILSSLCLACPKLPSKPQLIEKFITSQKCGDERRHGYYRAIRSFYKFINKRFGIPDIMETISPPNRKYKEPSFLLPEGLGKLFSYSHQDKIRAALKFLTDTGARLGELSRLQISDLDETPWGFTATINGKTGKRIVPISYETYHDLMVELPFPWSTHHLGILISRSCKAAGVKATAHTLRHTFGTLWEGDESILQRIMGHRHFATTERYRHLRTEYLARQHAKYSPLRMVYQTKSML